MLQVKQEPRVKNQAEVGGEGEPRKPVQLNIICDNCKKNAGSLITQKRKLKHGFFEIGMACPHCGFWGHSYYSNAQLEQARLILEKFKATAKRSPSDYEKYQKKFVEFQGKFRKVQEQASSLTGGQP